ncbi:PorV/PorQ family protein [Hoylesella loescheii]|uniref:PorV/PorQ family protein n=1 Tax=Hoylesella loescheii TaxID=840 RepID=UPI00248E2544|nr:PorV/PorQ family protein [Hoylesella loescheii]
MNSKHIIIACVALLCTMQARAQGQDLSVLAANPDARTAAMGNAAVAADGMYLYNNPSAFLCANKKLSADASASIYEKTEGYEGTFGLYTATVGYKFANRHAAFAGFRYAGGLKLKGYDMLGEPTKDYQPYNWTIDLGYAYMIGNGFSAYAVGNVIFSHLSKNAVGGAFTIGASYQKSTTTAGNKSANLMLDAKVGAIGPQLDYGNGNKTTMPTYVAVGGALTLDVADKHQVGGAWSTRYFFRPSEYKTLMLGAGLEYTYNKMVSLRAGYEYGDRNLSHFTMGAGFKYGGLHLNGAYMLKTANAGSSYCTIGLGYDF